MICDLSGYSDGVHFSLFYFFDWNRVSTRCLFQCRFSLLVLCLDLLLGFASCIRM